MTRRWLESAVLMLLGALALACTPSASQCEPIPMSRDAAVRFEALQPSLSWATPPCAYGRGFTVSDVHVESGSPGQRITFVVHRRGDFAFLFSQSAGVHRSPAIPAGSSRVELASGPVTASGFEGPTRAGDSMLYLRWELDGRISEFQATLGTTFSRPDAYRAVRGLIAQTTP